MMSNQRLEVVVSSGPPPVRVPDVRQRRLEDARADLAAVELGVGKVVEREVPSQPWGVVVGQSLAPRVEAQPGNVVDLTVGVPPWTHTPRLTDRSLGDAEEKLAKQGLRLGAVKLEAVAGKRAGTVVAQEPAPDVRLRQGEVVSVSIAVPQGARP
jgi:beta-lactam-binding protein with PASTA domain